MLPVLACMSSTRHSPLLALVRTRVRPLCIQYLTNVCPVQHSDCASSFSWCGNIRSIPPPCMSNVCPRYLIDMAEHSMCHPGRPRPHGLSHATSPAPGADFHSAKSAGLRLPTASTRPLDSCSSTLRFESLP